MQRLMLEIEDFLNFVDLNGLEGFNDSNIEKLEGIIVDCNHAMGGEKQVVDSIYDTLYAMLKQVKPNSKVLSEIWEEDGDITSYTDLLVKNPMMSIETAKSYTCDEFNNYLNRMTSVGANVLDYFASYKINGHGIRIVYQNGHLVSATSRARASAGRDLTKQMVSKLGGYNENLAGIDMIELRGEVALRLEKLGEARQFNPDIKSAFSAVASLLRPSTTPEEVELLDFLCYGAIMDGFSFNTRDEEFTWIQTAGYQTPEYMYIDNVNINDLREVIQETVQQFEDNYEEFGFFCDGVVFEVNDRQLFNAMGTEGNHNLANVALKVGVWAQDMYCGIVNTILWTKGKNKFSPVAIVSEEFDDADISDNGTVSNLDEIGILTAQGNKVRRVPLYSPKNIWVLEAYPGQPLNFRYGGEAGVVPCFPDGRLLGEDFVQDIIEDERVE